VRVLTAVELEDQAAEGNRSERAADDEQPPTDRDASFGHADRVTLFLAAQR